MDTPVDVMPAEAGQRRGSQGRIPAQELPRDQAGALLAFVVAAAAPAMPTRVRVPVEALLGRVRRGVGLMVSRAPGSLCFGRRRRWSVDWET